MKKMFNENLIVKISWSTKFISYEVHIKYKSVKRVCEVHYKMIKVHLTTANNNYTYLCTQ